MKRFKKILMTIITIILLLVIAVVVFMQQPQFGKAPSGEVQKHLEQSPNYRDNKFQNLSPTRDLAEGVSMFKVMKEFFFNKSKRDKPEAALPSKKEDLLHLDPEEDVIVWFGHSSYFIQADGKTILADPVFSGNASPVSFTTKAFAGSDVYTVDDLPFIDYLFITHDHWDHLDYDTVLKLKGKVGKIITGLGTGEHLRYWGYDPAIIIEKDWNETVSLGDGFTVYTTPARHFSGRGFKRNGSLWMSFVVKTPSLSLYLGGDSGYDSHYKAIGEKFGPFDVVMLECGQYNEYWKYIHMMPEEVVMAAKELQARKLMPVHWGKFSLGLHDWDEPIIRVTAEAAKQNMPVATPMIGQKINIKSNEVYPAWWAGLE